MRVACLLTKGSGGLKANKGEDGQNHPNPNITALWNRAKRKRGQRKTALLTDMEDDDGRQDESHTYFKDHEGQVNIGGLTNAPVAEGKSESERQDKPEAPVQIEAEPSLHQRFQIDSKQCKGVGDADDDRDESEPGRQVAHVLPHTLGHEGEGQATGRTFPP